MKREDFHREFQMLTDAFPSWRIGPTVEATWYDRLVRFGAFKIRAAFQGLSLEERFPTLGAAASFCRASHARATAYAFPSNPDGCHAQDLSDLMGDVRCGCSRCQPELFMAYCSRYQEVYGRVPTNPEPGPAESKATARASNPGGEAGFRATLQDLRIRRPADALDDMEAKNGTQIKDRIDACK